MLRRLLFAVRSASAAAATIVAATTTAAVSATATAISVTAAATAEYDTQANDPPTSAKSTTLNKCNPFSY